MAISAANQRIVEQLRKSVVTILLPKRIYGRGYSFRTAKEFLRQTNLRSAAATVCLINAVASEIDRLGNLDNKEKIAHLGPLYRFLFSRRSIFRAARYTNEEIERGIGHFTPLSPWACAALTDSCLRFCHLTSGASVFPPSKAEYFTRILLSFQGQLAPDRSTPEVPDFENPSDSEFVDFTRNHLHANNQRHGREDLNRLYAMFEVPEVGEILKAKCGQTGAEWFEAQTGMTPTEYQVCLLALVATTMEFKLEVPDAGKLEFDLNVLLCIFTPKARDNFARLNQLAVIDLRALRSEPPPTDWKTAVYRSNYLLRRQLLQVGATSFLVMHRDLYLDRFFRGIMHLLDDAARSATPPRPWKKLRLEFGYLFEGYVRWWLRRLFGQSAHFLFGVSLEPNTETDAVVIVGRTALVFECNHHYLSRNEAFDASPKILSAVVEPDLKKAIRAARSIAKRGVLVDGRTLEIEVICPIAVLPDALPIGDITSIRFHQELTKAIDGLDGEPPRIRSAQIISQSHFQYFDQVWRLPEQVSELVAYLEQRAATEPARFGPLNYDAQKIRPTHRGLTSEWLDDARDAKFRTVGPGSFRLEGAQSGPA